MLRLLLRMVATLLLLLLRPWLRRLPLLDLLLPLLLRLLLSLIP